MTIRSQKVSLLIAPALLAFLLWATFLKPAGADVDDDSALPPAHVSVFTDLHAVAETARARHLPILVMFSQEGCGYCSKVREDFLKPMIRSGDYRDRVIMGEVHMDAGNSVRDFNGKMIAADDLALRYGAPVTPTVVFVDPEGRQLASKLVGMSTEYFYGGDLDNGIDQALKKMRATKTAMRPSL